jgi:outer membrane protein assembly factor BamB
MSLNRDPFALVLVLCGLLGSGLAARQKTAGVLPAPPDAHWRISPEKVNIVVGEDRPLQLLDDEARALATGQWSIDQPDVADLEQTADGHAIVHAKAAGVLRVTATIGAESRSRDITIWADGAMPQGTTKWAIHPIGRELGDIPAVPKGGGPNVFSLEQTSSASYLRADDEDGMQVWSWQVPDETRDVELLCGDWLGGAVISVNHKDSYTIYDVTGDGTLRWKYTARGERKGYAISTEGLVHLVSRLADGTNARVTGLDEDSGTTVYDLAVPESIDRYLGLEENGGTLTCAPGLQPKPTPTAVTRPFVHIDGNAYVAFTQRSRTIAAPPCDSGATASPGATHITREDSLVLWQIHPDGTYRTTVVEAFSGEQSAASSLATSAPTASITPNAMLGVLIPVRVSRRDSWLGPDRAVDDFVYGLDAEGALLYKAPMPRSTGPLHDEMVLGEHDTAFAARGGILIAFDQRTGKELWRWDSHTPEIEVFAALANGHCAVQTPTALVEVTDAVTSKELMKGKAMMDWLGHMYIKHR